MTSWNHLGACQGAFERNEFFQYLEGTGEYPEPPTQYEDNPPTNVDTRTSCINSLYADTNDERIIETFKAELIRLAKGNTEQLKLAIRYIGSHGHLQKKGRASFQIDEAFLNEISKTIVLSYKQSNSPEVREFIEYWAESIEEKYGKNLLSE